MAKSISIDRQRELIELSKKTEHIIIDDYPYGCMSTIWAPDMNHFETAVQDERYGTALVLQEYKTRTEAIAGHSKWYKLLMENPPEYLEEKSTSQESPNEFGTKFYKKY